MHMLTMPSMKRIFKKIHIHLLVCVNNDVWPMPWDFKDIDIDWRWWVARQLTMGQLVHLVLYNMKDEHDFNKFKNQCELINN